MLLLLFCYYLCTMEPVEPVVPVVPVVPACEGVPVGLPQGEPPPWGVLAELPCLLPPPPLDLGGGSYIRPRGVKDTQLV